MKDFRKALQSNQLIPVVEIDEPDQAPALAAALLKGGLGIVEVTMRTPNSLEAAERMTANEDIIVGLGTIMEADQFRYAAQIGAQFTTSPGFNEDLLSVAKEEHVSYLPGVFTASEIMLARDLDYSTLKFFPAYTPAGLSHYPQVAAAFRQMWFSMTGGVSEANFIDTLKMAQVIAVGGSWLAPRQLIAERDWDGITERVRRAKTLLAESLKD